MLNDRLQRTLSRHISHDTALGSSRAVNRERIQGDLEAEKSHVRNIFLMAAVMTALLFAVMLGLILFH